MADESEKPSLLERLSHFLMREPEDREQLLAILHQAHERSLLDADALSMIEGVMQVSELSARDIMVPRSQMDMVDIADSVENIVKFAIDTTHSRFPVYEGVRDNVIGILLAKDLLPNCVGQDVDIRDMLRPTVFIPESKPLNVLLRDFRLNRNHIAMVVDEYCSVAGLVTIEDVLEQIVGDIEDEYDFDEESDNIVAITGHGEEAHYRVRALTEIEYFNEVFATNFSDGQSDTVGGLLADHLGRVPKRGEVIVLPPIRFEVLRADARQVHVLKVERVVADEQAEQAAADDVDHYKTAS
jgi:magnesium and cobalt transporter